MTYITTMYLLAGLGLHIAICLGLFIYFSRTSGSTPRLETPAEQAKREELQRVIDRINEGRY